jgi:hypothetical protein
MIKHLALDISSLVMMLVAENAPTPAGFAPDLCAVIIADRMLFATDEANRVSVIV